MCERRRDRSSRMYYQRIGRFIMRVIDDDNGTLLVFPSELGDQEYISCVVERPLYLCDKLLEEKYYYVSRVVLTK